MKKPSLHIILFAVIMAVLCLPLVQHVGNIFHIRKVDGFTAPVEPVKLSLETYRNQTYQEYVRKNLQNNFGFRDIYIRAYNQFVYSCFHETTNHNIVMGRNGELYLQQYTNVYTGKVLRDHYGTADSARVAMRQNVEHTLRVIDTLRRFGTDIIVVLAPSKPLICPEYLPDQIQQEHSPFSIQEEYAKLYEEAGVEHINFIPIFRELKKTSRYPVYTKHGTHWAYSTIPFVADTILQKIASVKHFPMPHTIYVDSNLTTNHPNSDSELEAQLNLLFPLRHDRIPNPRYRLETGNNFRKPNLLVVGDSYFDQLNKTDFAKAFQRVDFWKYNETAYSDKKERSGKIPLLQRYEIITQADVILLIFTDMHAYDYFFGFLNTVERALEDGPGYDAEETIQGIIVRIKASPDWYDKVVRQAKEKGISIEQCLHDNAQWVFEQEHR